jgi:aminoglycoside 3-N-acetyltransferase
MTPFYRQIRKAVEKSGLSNSALCLHTSFSDFSAYDKDPEAFVKAFLDCGCTLIVPTHSWGYLTSPSLFLRPLRNAWDYSINNPPNSGKEFTTSSLIVDKEMGVISRIVLEHSGSIRGNHPLCSFTGIGPLAKEIIPTQTWQDVNAPVRKLVELDGYAVMAGTDLTTLTALHYAEQVAGKTLFMRWALEKSECLAVESGGCSKGFQALWPQLQHLFQVVPVTESHLTSGKLSAIIEKAAEVISNTPSATICSNSCPVCRDTLSGGPVTHFNHVK